MKYQVWALIGQYGRKIGLSMITVVALWDVLLKGLRGFMEYAVCWKGIAIILIGVWMIWQGEKIERND